MNSIDVLVLNFEEVRRRSIKLWTSIPKKNYFGSPTMRLCLASKW